MSSVGDEEQTENPDFEALIDLLGTDDPDDEPQAGEQSFAPIANLRQADGRFDFSAIRDFFGVNLRSPQVGCLFHGSTMDLTGTCPRASRDNPNH